MAQDDPTERVVQDESEDRGRGYRWLGVVAAVAMVGVAVVAALGVTVPGFLATDQWILALGGTTIVLALAVVATLFLLDRSFSQLERHRNAIDAQQDAIIEAREEAWKRHEELQNRRFGERIGELRERLEDLDAEHAALSQQTRRSTQPTPFGDIHEIEDVRGIHGRDSDILREMGVRDTEQLWMGNAKRIADRLDRESRTIRRWQHQAELMALPRVGARSAEILARSGVHSIAELAAWRPERLLDRLESRPVDLETEPEEDVLSRTRVESWIENARAHDPSAYRVHRRRGSYPASSPA